MTVCILYVCMYVHTFVCMMYSICLSTQYLDNRPLHTIILWSTYLANLVVVCNFQYVMQLYRMQWKYHMHIHIWLIITNCLVLSLFQVHAICVVQRSSFNVTSESGHPVTTLVPVSVHSAVHSAVHRTVHSTVHSTVHRIESRNFFKVNFKPTDNDSVNTCSITTGKKRIKKKE